MAVGSRPAACSRVRAAWQRAASTGHGTDARGHCAQCASSARSVPVHPQHAGHCDTAAAAMTKRAAGLAAGSLRQASPQQRGHCLGNADTQRAPPPQHRCPAAKNARGVRPFGMST